MKKLFFRLPESMTPQARNAFLTAMMITAVHVAAVPYYLYLSRTTGAAQFSPLIAVTCVLAVLCGIGAVLIRRGQLTQGTILVLGAMAVVYPPVSATLVSGLGRVLGPALMLVGLTAAFQFLPKRSSRVMTVVSIVSGLATLLLDIFGSTVRPSLPNMVIQLLAVLVVGLLGFFIVRQFRNYSLRTKFIIVFTVVVMVAVSVIAFLNNRNSRAALTASADEKLLAAASETATRVDDLITFNLNIVRTEAETTNELAAFLSLRASGQPTDEEAAKLAAILSAFAQRDPQNISSYALLDSKGVDVADTFTEDIGVDKSKRVYFQVPMKTGQPYVSPMTHSPTRQGDIDLYFASPVRDASGKILGVLRFSYSAAGIQKLITQAQGLAGAESFPVLLDENFIRLAHGTTPDLIFKSVVPLDPALLAELQAAGRLPAGTPKELSSNLPDLEAALKNVDAQPIFTTASAALGGSLAETAVARMKTQPWIVYFRQPQDVFLAPIEAQTRSILLLAVVIILLASGAAAGLAQFLVAPITNLTATAERIAAGDLNIQARIESEDETGVLAKTFNAMTAQLRGMIGTLESRVAERTHSLELAAEVGRSVSQVRALDVMLRDAAEIIRSRFDLYYTQVYLTNPSQNTLILQSGTGTVGAELVGRRHSLPINTSSINGRATVEKRSVIISDTTASTTFRPNPLLPDTRSEMAIPLMVGEKVVGVLDLQSRQAGALSQDILPAFEALAGQLAIAIQNANLLAETEQARAEVETQARRLVRKNWEEYLDAIHQPERTGFVFEENKILPLAEAVEIQTPAEENVLTAPIAIASEPLGSLVVEVDAQNQNAQNAELVNIVARQVAQQIENLRLLENAERYRSEAEQAARRTTVEGWKQYMESRTGESLAYLYDTREVRSHGEDLQKDGNAFTLPIKAREETVGKLAIEGIQPDDKDAIDLANTIVERLGAHIDSLRLFEETKRGQIELDRRAQQLEAVAEISTVSSKEMDIDKMLASVVHLTQRKFGLYHAHVFTYNENTADFKIAACGWKEGDEHEGTHGTASIPLDQEQSLVARAGRTRQAVIVNDVHNEPGWLPNPLLPDTASEMAVPLVIGNEILGVLDVQSDHLNAFSDEDANIQTTLASQVATALQNARSFAKAQRQADREATLNVIGQKIQSATTVEAVLQIAARELGRALGAPLTIAQLGIKENSDNGDSRR